MGLVWFALRTRLRSIVPGGSGGRARGSCAEGREELEMNDLLEVRSEEREGVPGRVRRLAQSGGGWSRSNLYDEFR